MIAHLWLKANAAAVLVARAYRYLCPICGEPNIEKWVVPQTACRECGSVLQVREVCFSDGETALTPGTPPKKLTQALLFGQPGGEVDLSAVGYIWACGECDPLGERPHHTVSLADHLTCSRCRAVFPLLEICHRLTPELRPNTLLRNALSVMPPTLMSKDPKSPLSFEGWSFFKTQGEN